MSAVDLVASLRAGQSRVPLDALPYAALLGVHAEFAGEAMTLVMPFGPQLIGAPGRLHGGAIAGLLELSSIAALLRALPDDTPRPRFKPVNVTVDFMREGQPSTTHASAVVTRLGRRIANLRATAWQADPTKPIAGATMNVLLDRS